MNKITSNESIAVHKRARRAATSQARKHMRETFTKLDKGTIPFKGIVREQENKNTQHAQPKEWETLNDVDEFARMQHLQRRENESRDYHLSPRNIVSRMFTNTNTGKQIIEDEKQATLARYRLLKKLRHAGLIETYEYFSREWKLIV